MVEMATSCILYMIQRLVLVGLLMLKELVQSVGLVDSLGLIGEEDGVSVEGDAQLSLRDFRHLLWSEHGGRCYACIKGRGGRGERERQRRAHVRPEVLAGHRGGAPSSSLQR